MFACIYFARFAVLYFFSGEQDSGKCSSATGSPISTTFPSPSSIIVPIYLTNGFLIYSVITMHDMHDLLHLLESEGIFFNMFSGNGGRALARTIYHQFHLAVLYLAFAPPYTILYGVSGIIFDCQGM